MFCLCFPFYSIFLDDCTTLNWLCAAVVIIVADQWCSFGSLCWLLLLCHLALFFFFFVSIFLFHHHNMRHAVLFYLACHLIYLIIIDIYDGSDFYSLVWSVYLKQQILPSITDPVRNITAVWLLECTINLYSEESFHFIVGVIYRQLCHSHTI